MGCWGVTALESDVGLDAVGFIRKRLPEDGKLELEAIIEALKQDEWNYPDEPADGQSHTSPMALAEVLFQLMEQDMEHLDYEEGRRAKEKKFSDLTAVSASKDALQWLKRYLSETLQSAERKEEQNGDWNGWYDVESWLEWHQHMTKLIGRLEDLLCIPGDTIDLLSVQSSVQQAESGQMRGYEEWG